MSFLLPLDQNFFFVIVANKSLPDILEDVARGNDEFVAGP